MLPLPNPPTDNLYKFMAIGGLVGFLVIFLSPLFLNHVNRIVVEEYGIEAIRRDGERRFQMLEKPLKDDSPETAKKREDVLKAIHESEIQVIGAIKKGRDTDLLSYFNSLWWLMSFTFCIVSAFGFIFWAWNIQHFQDGVMKYQFEKDKREFEQADASVKASQTKTAMTP